MAGEFKGDFTRDTFRAYRHYSSVFQQQGRVSLDADGNEQASILLNLLRSVDKDIIADGDAPANGQFILFAFTPPAGSPPDRDFAIMPGHVFVDGVLCALNGSKNPFSIVDSANGKIQVSQWLVDGIPYQKYQYATAVVVDPTKPKDTPFNNLPAINSVDSLDSNARTLTIKPPLSAPAGAPLNGYRLIRIPTFLHQPDYVPTDDERKALANFLVPGQTALLVYLDAWERHISYIQTPRIREVALGGPDTCVRSQLLSQIKIAWDLQLPFDELRKATKNDVQEYKSLLEDQYQPYNRGWLRARLKPVDTASPDPCLCHPDARYRGSENQLYRLEVHLPGKTAPSNAAAIDAASGSSTSGPTFKWSRNNASEVYPVISVSKSEVMVASTGRDVRSTLRSKVWVELLDDILILQGKPGPLLQVSEVSANDRRVTLVASSPLDISANDPNHPHPFLRCWDQKDSSPNGTSGGIPIIEATSTQNDGWFDLEEGIQIQFIPALSPQVPDEPGSTDFEAPTNSYRTGDYWLIPARTALQGSIEWPATSDNPPVPIALAPHGVDHHYLPLGVVTLASATSGQLNVTAPFISPINPII
jgi:Family of unknown function (DUF6519)